MVAEPVQQAKHLPLHTELLGPVVTALPRLFPELLQLMQAAAAAERMRAGRTRDRAEPVELGVAAMAAMEAEAPAQGLLAPLTQAAVAVVVVI